MTRIHSATEFFRRFPVVVRLRVLWGEMDAFQHVNNTVYFKYQEAARLQYFKDMTNNIQVPKFDVKAFHMGRGPGPILTDTNVKFICPVVADDTLLIGATAHMLEGSLNRFKLSHSMFSLSKNRIVAEGHGTIACFNYLTGKVENFHPQIIESVGTLAAKNSSHLEALYSIPL